MDRKETRAFITRAKKVARDRGWAIHRLSRELFNDNPYGFQRLEEALRTGKGGPPHINVLDAVEKLATLEEEDESRELCV